MMVLFYHGIGVLLMPVGSFATENIISGYEEPSQPVSLSIASALSAEPMRKYCSLAYSSALIAS
jgi:hypothetical protein